MVQDFIHPQYGHSFLGQPLFLPFADICFCATKLLFCTVGFKGNLYLYWTMFSFVSERLSNLRFGEWILILGLNKRMLMTHG